jgi:hypothetical protein
LEFILLDPNDLKLRALIGDETTVPSGGMGGLGEPDPRTIQKFPPGIHNGPGRDFRIFDISALADGSAQTIQMDYEPAYWLVYLTSGSGLIYLADGQNGIPARLSGSVRLPGRGNYLTVRNNGGSSMNGTVIAFRDFDVWAQLTAAGGSSGGAVTVADGDDVALGATTDAAVVTDTTGTVSGKLRGLVKWAFERMPASLGQKTSAASFPVVLPSDQTVATSIAAGSDVTTGNTTDAAVVTDTTGTVSGKLRGLVKWAFERMPASLGQKTSAASFPVVLPSDQTVATSIAAGSDVTTGNTTDAAVVTDTTGTVSGKLRGLVKWAFERMPASLGQKAASASLAVVLPSDHADKPIAGAVYNSGGTAYTVKTAAIAATSDGDNTIIAAVASKKLTILSIMISTTAAGLVALKDGAASTKGTLRSGGDGYGFSQVAAPGSFLFQGTANTAFIINNATGVDTYGWVTYIEMD